MKIIETIALITINETLIFQLVSFLLFMFLVNRIMIRPLRRVMNEREELLVRISGEISSTRQSFQQVEQQIKAQEKAARRAAFEIRNKIEASGQHAADDILAKTRESIVTMKDKAHQQTADQLAAARHEIEREAVTISDRMIASLLGQRSAP
jgi:F-type H+-transporting ATPase subunit b